MSNIRNLKKDIAHLTGEIISDVQVFMYLHPTKNADVAYSIMEEAVEMYKHLYLRVNNPDGKDDRKLVKRHYNSIEKDLHEQSHKLFERIAKLNE